MCRAPIAGARRAVECQTGVWACGRQAAPGAESGATEAGTRRSRAGDCNKTTGTEPSEGVLHDRVKNVNVLAVQAVDGSHPSKTKSSNRRGQGGGCAREQVQEKSVFGQSGRPPEPGGGSAQPEPSPRHQERHDTGWVERQVFCPTESEGEQMRRSTAVSRAEACEIDPEEVARGRGAGDRCRAGRRGAGRRHGLVG